MSEKSKIPEKKVAFGGIGGALATAIVAILGNFNVDLGPEFSAALAGIISFAFAYMKRS
jgi:putative flippase GtrA